MATQQDLEEAKEALHKLMTGKQVVSVQKDGRTVTFTSASLSELRSYISNMESQLGLQSRRRPPARFGL